MEITYTVTADDIQGITDCTPAEAEAFLKRCEAIIRVKLEGATEEIVEDMWEKFQAEDREACREWHEDNRLHARMNGD